MMVDLLLEVARGGRPAAGGRRRDRGHRRPVLSRPVLSRSDREPSPKPRRHSPDRRWSYGCEPGRLHPMGRRPHQHGVSDPAGGATRSLGSFPVPRPRGVLSSRAPRVALPMADGVTAGKDEARPAAAESSAGQDPRRGFMRGRRCRPRAFLSSSASEGSARCCPSAPS